MLLDIVAEIHGHGPGRLYKKRNGPGSSEVVAKEEEKKEGGGVEILVGTPVIEFYSTHSHNLYYHSKLF